MKRLHKFLRLPGGERWLLLKAALLLGLIRIGLSLLSFQTLKQLLESVSRASSELRGANPFSSDRIVWAVITASRYVLGTGGCLTQALAVQALLKRQGYPSRLRLGVRRPGGKHLQAHAWVESQDRVVVGGGELTQYTPLTAFDGESNNERHRSI